MPIFVLSGGKLGFHSGLADSCDGCDLILIQPSKIARYEDTIIKTGATVAKILIGDAKVLSYIGEQKCQTILLQSENLTELRLVDKHYKSWKVLSKVVILTKNSQILDDLSRRSYDLQALMQNGMSVAYSASKDKRWRTMRVAWAEIRPYIHIDQDGHMSGIDFDMWKVIGSKLGIKVEYRNKSETLYEVYKALPMGKAELAGFGTAFTETMLQVKNASYIHCMEAQKN